MQVFCTDKTNRPAVRPEHKNVFCSTAYNFERMSYAEPINQSMAPGIKFKEQTRHENIQHTAYTLDNINIIN
jgi:hypothetical protein